MIYDRDFAVINQAGGVLLQTNDRAKAAAYAAEYRDQGVEVTIDTSAERLNVVGADCRFYRGAHR